MSEDVLIIRPCLNFPKGEDLVTVREMVLRQMKEGVIMLPFGYEIVKTSKDSDVHISPDKDERKVIHNATTYICMAEKNGRPGEAENIAQKLYDRAYRKGYEAGKAQLEKEDESTPWDFIDNSNYSPFDSQGKARLIFCTKCGRNIKHYDTEYQYCPYCGKRHYFKKEVENGTNAD